MSKDAGLIPDDRGLIPWFALSALVGLVLFALSLPKDVQRKRISFRSGPDHRLAASVYKPGTIHPSGKAPAAVLCHGVSCSKEQMGAIACDLADHGFVVLAFDYAGHGESDRGDASVESNLRNVRAAIEQVRRLPEVNPEKVVLLGHSMGVPSAVLAADSDRRIRAVAALGQKAPCNPDGPRNLLQGFGLYDQFHTISSAAAFLSANSEGPKLRPVSTVVALDPDPFKTKNHRALLVAPDVDHTGEIYSPRIIRDARNWMLAAVGKAPSNRFPKASLAAYGRVLGGFGICGLTALLLVAAGRRLGKKTLTPRFQAALPLAALVPAAALSPRLGISLPTSSFLLLLYLASSLGSYALHRRSMDDPSPLRRQIQGLAYLSASLSLGSLLASLPEMIADREALLYAPLAAINIIIHRLHSLFFMARPLFFSEYSENLRPSILLLVILIAEPLHPGWLWSLCAVVARAVKKRVLECRLSLSIGLGNPKASLALAFVSIGFVLIVHQRYREGFISMDSIETTAIVLLRTFLLPALALVALLRSGAERPKQASIETR